MTFRDTDIAVVGAGPYGLSLAAHLRGLGVEHRVFGRPLATWRAMPPGMKLKSDGFASNLSAPGDGWSLREYCAEQGISYRNVEVPVALETFVAYGEAFQRKFAPHLETADVTAVAPADGGGWRVALETGEAFTARRVVLAVGITHYASIPEVFAGAAGRVTHSSAHHDFGRFRGQSVAVVGAGSSAVDMAIGLAGVGVRPKVIIRDRAVGFTTRGPGGQRSLWRRIRHPQSGLGPGLRSRLACDAPDLFRFLPAPARVEIVRRHLGPLSHWHQRDAFEDGADVLAERRIASVSSAEGRLRIELAGKDGGRETLDVDHVICATGYRADVGRLGFLDAGVRGRLRTVADAPVLSPSFESSERGLYFLGLSAAATFGPLMRFMHGDDFAARRLSRRLAGTR